MRKNGKKELEMKITELGGVKIERDDYKNKKQKAKRKKRRNTMN